MEKLLRSFLSALLIVFLSSCKTEQEKIEAAMEFGKHAGYQGTPTCMNAFAYLSEIDPTNAEAYRELSIPYLKRGMPHGWKKWIDRAVRYDSVSWQPYRGYNYLWFYRDYKKAIADFDASDTLTPYIDHPQGHSVDFWRGIAYLGLKDHENSISYWDKHIQLETEENGEDWVELEAYLYRGIAYYESGNPEKALENFDKVIKNFKQSADAKYHKAVILKESNRTQESLDLLEDGLVDFNNGFFINRPYVEMLRQIYMEDFNALKESMSE